MMFAMKSVAHQGRRMHGAIVTCRCGVTKTVPINTFTASPRDQDEQEQSFVRKKLEADGWFVGKKEGLHRCPGCHAKTQPAKADQKTMENVVTLPIKPDAPREMSRDDRRIIFEKLNEVYIDEKVGYAPGWTDAKVATDLGVHIPRAWVTSVREEMFGPEGNEEIRATLTEARQLLNDIKVAASTATDVAETLKALLRKADSIEKHVLQIEKALR